jgi:hypothetical protein
MADMPLYCELQPSRSLVLLFFIFCAVSLVSIWMLSLPGLWLLVLTAVTLGWVGYGLLLYASLSMGHSCVAFRMEDQAEIVMVLHSGRHLPGRVSPDSFVTPYLVILNVVLSEQHKGRNLLILPDAMGVESFRRLRIHLQWGDKPIR